MTTEMMEAPMTTPTTAAPATRLDALSGRKMKFIDAILEYGPVHGLDLTTGVYSRHELVKVCNDWKGKRWIPNWVTHDQNRRVGRGTFSIPEVTEAYNAQNSNQN